MPCRPDLTRSLVGLLSGRVQAQRNDSVKKSSQVQVLFNLVQLVPCTPLLFTTQSDQRIPY